MKRQGSWSRYASPPPLSKVPVAGPSPAACTLRSTHVSGQVRVPDGAEAGTLLRVPVPEAASPVGDGKAPTVSSDPAVLTQVQPPARGSSGGRSSFLACAQCAAQLACASQ